MTAAQGIPFGRYRLLRKLAAGGMAEIFLALLEGPSGFDKEVVVKRLFGHYAANPTVLRLFQDEARVAADLNHPNIAHIYELGCVEDQWFIAMEHIPGRPLAEVCRRGVRAGDFLPLAHSVRIICQACEGLHYVHTKVDRAGVPLGLVHRDITPANLLITFDGIVKILDFGIARTAARPDTDPGALKGTLAYMSPEQVLGQPLDPRSDLFSLGVILFELTLGTRLFRGTDPDIVRRITVDPVPSPRFRDPRYPAELEQIVLRALERDRDKRYPNVATLQWDLEDFCARRGLHSNAVRLAQYLRKLFGYVPAYEQRGIVPSPESAPRPERLLPVPGEPAPLFEDDYDRTAERPALLVVEAISEPEATGIEPSGTAPFSLDLDDGDGEAAFLVRLERMMEAEARALRDARITASEPATEQATPTAPPVSAPEPPHETHRAVASEPASPDSEGAARADRDRTEEPGESEGSREREA